MVSWIIPIVRQSNPCILFNRQEMRTYVVDGHFEKYFYGLGKHESHVRVEHCVDGNVDNHSPLILIYIYDILYICVCTRPIDIYIYIYHDWAKRMITMTKHSTANPCVLFNRVYLPYGLKQVFYEPVRHTFVGNKIVGHSDVVGAWPVGAAPTTSSSSRLKTWLQWIGQRRLQVPRR